MPDMVLEIPAPYGVGVVMGLIKVVPQNLATTHRGPLKIYQGDSHPGGFKSGQNQVIKAAKKARLDLRTWPWPLMAYRGFVGSARLVHCQDLRHPRNPYKWRHHFNLGYPGPALRWGWILEDPHVVGSRDPHAGLVDHQIQQALFAGA
jgi:hypothetical protein